MFLCHSSKTLGKALKTNGSSSLQVPAAATRLRNVTLTLYKVHTQPTHRALCLTSFQGQVSIANHTKGQEMDLNLRESWDSSCGFTTDWQHFNRVATIVTCLSKSVQRQGGRGDFLTPQLGSVYWLHVTTDGAEGNVCFSGNSGVFNRRCFSTGTMQTRASSTAAAKQREAGEEQTVSSNKGDEQNLKDVSSSSTTSSSSSAEKAPGNPEPEPEGGKPNKTQQLKKVFKEYGAVGVSFHVCISIVSLGMFYLLVSSGIDMAAVLCKVGFSEAMVKSKMAAGTSTFVLAYAIHKLFAPVRISITLVSVPLIVRYFRKTGLFKAPPHTP